MYAGFRGSSGPSPLDLLGERAQSICRERLNEKLRDKAAIGVALAESRSAVDMISKRSLQLYDFTRKLRRFDFKGAGRALGVSVYGKKGAYRVNRSGRSRPINLRDNSHAYADNFLEYWFGWAPMIGDIHDAAGILSEPFTGADKVEARAKLTDTYSNRVNTFYPWAPVYDSASHSMSAVCKASCRVNVSNPNLNLASQMGLTNPALIAWELVPFSFVVDYFVNVSDYLGNFDSLLGLDITAQQSTLFLKDTCNTTQTWWDNRYYRSCTSEFYYVNRGTSLPEVTLRTKQVTLPIGRALSSIALLITLGLKR